MAWIADATIVTSWSAVSSAGDGWQTVPFVEILTEDGLHLLTEGEDVLFTEQVSLTSLWTAEIPP